jgi:methylenetetrahydrofolate reductase (NADPH)
MVVVGQDPAQGDQRLAKPVYDLGQQELLETANTFMAGKDMAGVELSGVPKFTLGTMVDPADPLIQDQELESFQKGLAQGVGFFVTPPLFELAGIDPFVQKIGPDKSRLIITVLLLKSFGMARYINLHLKNVSIPESYLERFKKTKDRGREGVLIAAETIRSVREAGFGGVMISPLGWEDRLPDILDLI